MGVRRFLNYRLGHRICGIILTCKNNINKPEEVEFRALYQVLYTDFVVGNPGFL